jgi:benzoyl-CoA reductase/2-hydroxyglutaryl-CoA dehydratase subunit BcrC/BadD/HgdB
MGYLETEIERCNRRIKSIEAKPDPKQLRVNKLLYEIQRDRLQKQLDVINGGEPFVYAHGGPGLDFVMEAMGVTPFHIIGAADRADKMAPEYFKLVRGAGYPSTICDRFQMSLGMILSGDAPKPQAVIACQACDVEVFSNMAAAHFWNLPYYFVDFRYEVDIPIEHSAEQMREMIDFVEKHVPGAKYDESRLIELLYRRRQALEYLHEVGQLLKTVPTPVSGKDAFRIVNPRIALEPRGIEYFRALRDEVRERVETKTYPVPTEKLRILWAVTGPYFMDVFQILEKHDASVPIFLWSNVPENFGLTPKELWDVSTNIGRQATPLEEVTSWSLSTWFRTAESWVREVVYHCKELSIDGIVYYQLSGCPTCRSSARMVSETVEKELGIPMLQLEGWMLDKEKFDPVLTEEKLEEFLSFCESRKLARTAAG